MNFLWHGLLTVDLGQCPRWRFLHTRIPIRPRENINCSQWIAGEWVSSGHTSSCVFNNLTESPSDPHHVNTRTTRSSWSHTSPRTASSHWNFYNGLWWDWSYSVHVLICPLSAVCARRFDMASVFSLTSDTLSWTGPKSQNLTEILHEYTNVQLQ